MIPVELKPIVRIISQRKKNPGLNTKQDNFIIYNIFNINCSKQCFTTLNYKDLGQYMYIMCDINIGACKYLICD